MPTSDGVGVDLDLPQGLLKSGQGRLNRSAPSCKGGMPGDPRQAIQRCCFHFGDETLSRLDLSHSAW